MPRKEFRPYTKEELDALEALLKAGFSLTKAIKIFGVRSVRTLKVHAQHQPELKKIIEHGLSTAIANVANSLYLKAVGYDYNEDVYEVVGEDSNGEPILKLKKRTIKKVHPDVFAANSFLNNRAPDLWKTKREDNMPNIPRTLLISINNLPQNKQLAEPVNEINQADYEVIDGKDIDAKD